jgi:hypothetical protein
VKGTANDVLPILKSKAEEGVTQDAPGKKRKRFLGIF